MNDAEIELLLRKVADHKTTSPLPILDSSLLPIFLNEDPTSESPGELLEPPDESICQINYDEFSCQMFLGGRMVEGPELLLASPHLDSENERLIAFLYKHPNKRWARADIEKDIGKISKTFHQILNDLHFKDKPNLKRALFRISQRTISFRNPLTRTMLQESRIDENKLTEEIKQLRSNKSQRVAV